MPFGIQQQRLPAQNQLSLSNLLSQAAADNPNNALTAEKLLSSGLSQDPQILNMLQQQYLLQLHSQAAAQSQQIPLIDKLLLLKQQQKQEEQQQLLRQQQLLSQVLQDQPSSQLFSNLSYGQLQGVLPMGNLRVDPSLVQPQQEVFPMSSQTAIPNVHNEHNSNSLNLPPKVSQDTSSNVSSQASIRLPHQLFGDTLPEHWGPNLTEQIIDQYQKESFPVSSTQVDGSALLDQNRSKEEPLIPSLSPSDYAAKSVEQVQPSNFRPDAVVVTSTSKPGESSGNVESFASSIALSTAVSSVSPPVSGPGTEVKTKLDIVHQEQHAGKDSTISEPSLGDMRKIEPQEPKKASEKKSKKQKSTKSQSFDQTKGVVKNLTLQPSKQSETEMAKLSDFREAKIDESLNDTNMQQTRVKGTRTGSAVPETGDDHQQAGGWSGIITGKITEAVDAGEINSTTLLTQKTEVPAGRAWKPAPGVKAKSFLEIQQEEKRKAETETLVSDVAVSVNSMTLASPWAGIVANPDSLKVSSEGVKEGRNTENHVKSETSQNVKSKKSPLHDLLAEEVLKKSNEIDAEIPDSILPSHNIVVQSESLDDGHFIEAKDTKRSRKKSTKSKGSATKASLPIASSDVPIASSPNEKGKNSRLAQQEKEELPVIPAGPSFSDFVLWKGEREPPSSSPSPAWSTDSGRVPKPTSLRDILKEQEKKASSAIPVSPVPPPPKSQPTQSTRSNASSWSVSASSPSKAASPIQINTQASQSKYKGDDDLFWGPMEQSKQDAKQYDLYLFVFAFENFTLQLFILRLSILFLL